MNFTGEKLRLARLLNAKTLQDVAELTGESKQKIHKLENEQAYPDDGLVSLLSDVLKVRPDFFELDSTSGHPVPAEEIHFRSVKSRAKQADKEHDAAKVFILDQMLMWVGHELALPAYNIPEIPTKTDKDIELAANKCRHYWDLGNGPIDNIVRVLENAGVVVVNSDSRCDAIDGAAIDNRHPKVLRNTPKFGYRSRFTDAHELGHLVMHKGMITGDRETERQANRFASAFLMPAETFYQVFPRGYRLDWTKIEKLKKEWKVSKAAIFYRAKQIGAINDAQYKSAVIQMGNDGERKIEKGDENIQPEVPEILSESLQYLYQTRHWDYQWWTKTLGIHQELLSIVIGEKLLSDIGYRQINPKLKVIR